MYIKGGSIFLVLYIAAIAARFCHYYNFNILSYWQIQSLAISTKKLHVCNNSIRLLLGDCSNFPRICYLHFDHT